MATKYKLQPDGRYRAKVWDGTYTNTGKKHYKYLESTKSSKDLENKVTAFNEMRKSGEIITDVNITVTEYAKLWLKTEKGNTSYKTELMYDNIINKHIVPFMGHLKMSQLNRSVVKLLVTDKSDKPRTCEQLLMTLKQIVKSAEHDRILPQGSSNEIFYKLSPPKYRPKEKRPLTEAEKRLISCAEFTDREKAFVMLLYGTGLRREEALALTKFDIDFKKRQINVNKALTFVKSGSFIKEPKTENGYRSIPIPEFLIDILETQIKASNEYIFEMYNGEKFTQSGYNNMWAQIKKKMITAYGSDLIATTDGITDLTAHIFRHNYCTELCYQINTGKITLKKVAYLLGDTEKMVMDVYSHIIDEKEQTVDAIETAFKIS